MILTCIPRDESMPQPTRKAIVKWTVTALMIAVVAYPAELRAGCTHEDRRRK